MPARRRRSKKGRGRRRTAGPMTAAGLVRFFDDVDAKVKISPYGIMWIAIGFSAIVAVLGYVIMFMIK